jgi:hypothetical protein
MTDEEKKEALARVRAAEHNLANASREDLDAAKFLWGRHRAALGGFSSVTGAPLPDWEGMASNPMAQNAHLVMAIEARGYFFGERQTAKAAPQ